MLVFFNVSEEDYGNYTCVAMNTMGTTNASIILYGKNIRNTVSQNCILRVSSVSIILIYFQIEYFCGCFFSC